MESELPHDIIEFEKKLKKLLEDSNIAIETTVDFPQYKILPEEVRLALLVLQKHGGVFKPVYKRIA